MSEGEKLAVLGMLVFVVSMVISNGFAIDRICNILEGG